MHADAEGPRFLQAAALPEAFFTAWNNIVWLGRLDDGEAVLVQGGTSGVGMAAIQIARTFRDARVLATAGSEDKCRICRETGAHAAINYRGAVGRGGTTAKRRQRNRCRFDGQAGPYTERELDLLKDDGRVVLMASHLGATAEVNLRKIVRRRLTLTGATIRPRPPAYKGRIAAELVPQVWPLLEGGPIRMPSSTFPLGGVAEAHALWTPTGRSARSCSRRRGHLPSRVPRSPACGSRGDMPSFPPVQSVLRALEILNDLNTRRVTRVGELHHSTGLPKPTIVRLLETLIPEGFAASDNRLGGYQVTSDVDALGSGFHSAPMVVEAARPWASTSPAS